MTRRTQSLESAFSGWGSFESFFGSLATRFDGAVVRARRFTLISSKTAPRSADWSSASTPVNPEMLLRASTPARSHSAPILLSSILSVQQSSENPRDQINDNQNRRLLPLPAVTRTTVLPTPTSQDDTKVATNAAVLSLRRVVNSFKDEPQTKRHGSKDGNSRCLPRDRGAIIALSRELSRRRSVVEPCQPA